MDSDFLHINQWVTGADTDPVAVFLHGFMGSSKDWAFLSDQLSCTVLAIDLPGHGQSEALEDVHWIAATADQIAHQLQVRGIEKCHLIGYSLGGRIAMQLAIRYPNLFDRIVLESCHPGLDNQAERVRRKKRDKRWSKRFRTDWPQVLEDWYEQDVFASVADPSHLIQERLKNDPIALEKAMMGFSLSGQDSCWNQTHSILYLCGEFDPKYGDVGRRLSNKNASVRHQTVSHCGHNVHLESAETYLELLTSFLEIDLK
ncbi:MAG: 2-succinyl-6-hydroxy-2,4-cyclohexadiene-1-carboxylate synthase [Rhodothermales bacterium]|nr:2-succinyl-6-hydroxy-2,4-cyclohexadiene-1-carboxylate synthase [Rhodothermales bacterium]MDG2016645.1 2-succinyl-6-hydroxy-2,4-cyclohexadiene-1-carboxylate synthase [Rhodothermales bacterium]HAY37734.1 2-succinyl-6-hydroxy-2,4-cyclohexadiene-1-carboxylate synthase [Bacteroidota bacterium]